MALVSRRPRVQSAAVPGTRSRYPRCRARARRLL